MNIILIVIDALRAKNLGCYGFKDKISPNIDKLAKEGVLFKNAFSCINTTDPSLTTIFTGRYPMTHGIIRHGAQVKREDVEKFYKTNKWTLAKILKSEGYKTLAVDWLGRWHRIGFDYYSGILGDKQYGKTREYKNKRESNIKKFLISKLRQYPTLFKILESTKYKLSKKRAKEVPRALIFGDAEIVTEHAKQLIIKYYKNKFFLFIHYWDTHAPYYCPQAYAERYYTSDNDKELNEILKKIKRPERKDTIANMGKSVNEIISKYYGAIEFVDEQIGRLIEFLDNLGILDNTLIVLTSDHGESLIEHGIYFDHHGLYDVSIHVPLIFRCPETLPKGKVIDGFVQHVDIAPTILEVLGLPKYYGFDGYNLIPLILGETNNLRESVFVEEAQVQRKIAIRTSKFKYIKALSKHELVCRYCGIVHGNFEELYDLEADSNETNNIIKARPEIAKDMKRKLAEFILNLGRRKEQSELVGKGIESLKQLGKI